MMKRVVGQLLMVLILGFTLSSAVFSGYLVAGAQPVGNGDVYEDFWRILNREAVLVDTVNNGNLSAVPDLIANSRSGEENAANISAQIWTALEELEKSGVKLYYSPDELKAMAQNISRNGLPRDTVEALKEHGWTDEQIEELRDYISKNAENITTGFNMTSFLENFSTAFVRVGFKYAGYESWALKKWKWDSPVGAPSISGKVGMLNPEIVSDWIQFYFAYTKNDSSGMLKAMEDIRNRTYHLLIGTGEGERLGIHSYKYVLTQNWTEGGGIIFKQTSSGILVTSNPSPIKTTVGAIPAQSDEQVSVYYWPGALEAYRLSGDILVLLLAKNGGNTNPLLDSILNQKMDELKEKLVVFVISSTPGTVNPSPGPRPGPRPKPHPPIYAPGSNSLDNTHNSYYLPSNFIQGIPQGVIDRAISLDNKEGTLNVNVKVVTDEISPGEVKYHILVTAKAENNVVSDVTVKVSDSSSGGSDSGSLGTIMALDSVSWESREFSVVPSDNSVTITGTVTVTYTPSCGDVPASDNTPKTVYGTCYQPHTITESYSRTVKIDSPIDPSKVHFSIHPSKTQVIAGGSVEFSITITNDNNADISGDYSLSISIPQPNGNSEWTPPYTGHVTVPAGTTKTVHVATITYGAHGTSKYDGVFDFGVSSAQDSGEVIVLSSGGGGDQSSGSLEIINATPDNSTPKEGDSVTFNVKVKNSYSSSKSVKLRLFIDGSEVDSVGGSVSAGSTGEFSLHWSAEAGEHSYEVKLYRVEKGKEVLEDSASGSIEVSRVVNGLSAWIEVAPNPVEAGNNVTVYITVKNSENYKQTWPIELVDNTGNNRWPRKNYHGMNYSISDGELTIYANKTARITATVGPITQNTTLTLKIGGYQMASEYVEVLGKGEWLELSRVSCGDLFLQVSGTLDYKGTATCTVEFRNPAQSGIAIELNESRVISVDFPMDHSNGMITPGSATTIKAGKTGNVHISFEAWTSDFTAFARYWVYGYYDMPVSIKFELKMSKGNNFEYSKYGIYTFNSYITVKTSNTVYVAVPADVGSFFVGGEALKGVLLSAKAGRYGEAFLRVTESFLLPALRSILARLG